MLSLPAEEPQPAGDFGATEVAIAASRPEPGAELRGWIVIAEWEDSDGMLFVTGETTMPPWRASGLLNHAERYNICYDDEA